MSCPVIPLGSRVVIKALASNKVTASGIIIPDTVNADKPEKGEVVAVGPGKMLDSGKRADMDLKVGDVVLFSKYSPNEFQIDNEKYLILDSEDIKGKIVEK